MIRTGSWKDTVANRGLTLQLLRHAKSRHDNPELADYDRPLAPRGIRAAKAMGKAIAQHGLIPELVLCSPAVRAAETWRIVSGELSKVPKTRTIEDIYDFGDGGRLLDVIRSQGGNARSLMLVGHNPSMEELARRLIGKGPEILRQQLAAKFPTGAMAVIDFRDCTWAEIAEGSGELIHFMRPADVEPSTGG
jgi:phosphohistidine phosphatase